MACELTKEFFEKILGQPISSFEVKAGSNVGDNVQGELKAVSVKTVSGEILNLVHKTMAPDPFTRQFIVENQTFRIENTFYSRIAPQIENLIKSKIPADYTLPMPKFYAGFNNDNDDYITMEDLRPVGYRMVDKYAGLSYPETALVLKNIARFHAFTYYFVRYEGEKFFDTVDSGIKRLAWLAPEKAEEGELLHKGMVEMTIEVISKRNPDLAKQVSAKLEGTRNEDLIKTALATDKTYFPVIIHGDLWVNNIMFKYDDAGNPTAVKLIDFQLTRRGNIFEELQYFFLTSTTPELRRKHLLDALDVYHRSFVETLQQLNWPLPSYFTRGYLVDNLYKCFRAQYHAMPFAISMQLGVKDAPSKPQEDNTSQSVPPSGSDSAQPVGDSKSAESPPPSHGEPVGPFNLNDIPLPIRVGFFTAQLREDLERSPRAVDRLIQITEELMALNIL